MTHYDNFWIKYIESNWRNVSIYPFRSLGNFNFISIHKYSTNSIYWSPWLQSWFIHDFILLSYSAVEIYSVRLGGSRRERACKVYCDGQGYSLESHKERYRREISTWQRPGNVPECMQERRCPAVMQCRSQCGAPVLFDRCSCDNKCKTQWSNSTLNVWH